MQEYFKKMFSEGAASVSDVPKSAVVTSAYSS